MKTSLAYIDQLASERATSELMPKSRTELQLIGGFHIPVEVDYEPRFRVDSYRSTAEDLRSGLSRVGVTPLAVLPRAWWDEMVQQSKLISLPGDQTNLLLPIEAVAKRLEVFSTLTTAAFYGSVSGVALALSGGVDSPLDMLGCLVTGLVVGLVTSLFKGWFSLPFTTLLAHLALGRGSSPLEWLLELRERGGLREPSEAVPFRLPTPPEEVVETLLRLRNYQSKSGVPVSFAASPDAFIFDPPLVTRVVQKVQRPLRARMREREAADPIVYVSYGSAVAIVAQFGDFPIEKELVDRVMVL